MNPMEGPEWDRLVAAHAGATIFHTAAWARVLSRTYGHRPFYLSSWKGGRVQALIPVMEVRSVITGRRGVCVPFADFCGPLCFEGANPGPAFAALSALAAERGWKHWEIRGGDKPDSSATRSISFYSHSLSLAGGPDNVFEGFDPAVRRAVRKGERNGVEIAVRSDRGAMLAYYALHVRTRRRHGLPPQSLNFFLNIHEEIIQTGLGSVVIATQGGEAIAGAVFFHCGKRALYKFGACDERLLELRANNLVMWAGIRFLCESGCTSLDFGRTSISQNGLRRYKLGWGTTESTAGYYRKDVRTASWETASDRISGGHNALFSRFPLGLNRFLGRLIYSHLD